MYLFLGAIGIPVFAPVPDGYIGFASLFGPTGGYLLAFPVAAFIAGYIIEKNKNYFSVVLAMIVTEFIIILIGTIYLNIVFLHNSMEALKSGAIIFSLWTVIKIFAGASIYTGIIKTRKNDLFFSLIFVESYGIKKYYLHPDFSGCFDSVCMEL